MVQERMKKIGLRKNQNFSHPAIEKTNQLRPHVAYSINKIDLES